MVSQLLPSLCCFPLTPAQPPLLGSFLSPSRDNVETVVSIGAKEEAVVPNGREGTYVISAVDVR